MAVLLQRGDFLRCRKLCSTFVIPVSHLHQGGCSAILAVNYDVGVKRYFAPSDTELLRALHSRNSKNIRNPLIFLQKMASYSCFWRVPSSKILLQASLHRIYDLLTLVSNQLQIIEMIKIKYKICNQNKGWGMICQGKEEKKIKKECV